MSLSNLMGLLQQYENPAAANAGNTGQDFERVAQTASQPHVAAGLAQAFHSNETPPFSQMLSTLFSNSNGEQQAGILNQLVASLGKGAGSNLLGGLTGRSSPVTPEQAQQVRPETVQQLAEQAQKNDPSVVEKASKFYAQHPTLIKSLGADALGLIMSHMSRAI